MCIGKLNDRMCNCESPAWHLQDRPVHSLEAPTLSRFESIVEFSLVDVKRKSQGFVLMQMLVKKTHGRLTCTRSLVKYSERINVCKLIRLPTFYPIQHCRHQNCAIYRIHCSNFSLRRLQIDHKLLLRCVVRTRFGML